MSLIVVATGGRHYADREHVNRTLGDLSMAREIIYFLNGAATGADTLCQDYAEKYWRTIPIPAWWKRHGLAGGPIRNRLLLDLAEWLNSGEELRIVVVAFPGDEGTGNMKKQARERGYPVVESHDIENAIARGEF